MPADKRDRSNIREKIIYDTCYDAIVRISTFNSMMELMGSYTGFIVDVVQNRIIVLSCAHNILTNFKEVNSDSHPTITATVTNAYEAGAKNKNEIPISVSLLPLGLNISADVGVFYSILPGEEIPTSLLSYRFGKSTQQLDWATKLVLYGETVYTIGNMYGSNLSMIVGNCADNNIIYLPESKAYQNNIQQIITTLAVKGGASGGPILCYDEEMKKGVICGMIQWSKVDNDYTGGLNTKSLRHNYRKIYDLNIGCHSIKPIRLNFNGSTGKGYSGVATYQYVSGSVLTKLNSIYPKFNQSKYRNQASGIQITEFSRPGMVLPNSRVENALNISRCDYLKRNTRAIAISDDKIKEGDILMEVNGQLLGDEEQSIRLSDINYYDAGKIRFIKCLRPETAQVRYYRYIVDRAPAELEYVSKDDTIEVLC